METLKDVQSNPYEQLADQAIKKVIELSEVDQNSELSAYDSMLQELDTKLNFFDSQKEVLKTEIKKLQQNEGEARTQAREQLDFASVKYTDAQELMDDLAQTLEKSEPALQITRKLK